MDMTDDHIDHITDIITKIIWCPDVSVFPQWQPHRHGAPTKCLWNKILISFLKAHGRSCAPLSPSEMQPDDGSISEVCVSAEHL